MHVLLVWCCVVPCFGMFCCCVYSSCMFVYFGVLLYLCLWRYCLTYFAVGIWMICHCTRPCCCFCLYYVVCCRLWYVSVLLYLLHVCLVGSLFLVLVFVACCWLCVVLYVSLLVVYGKSLFGVACLACVCVCFFVWSVVLTFVLLYVVSYCILYRLWVMVLCSSC